ncbi:universal stress protein [Natrarchaeobaculum sulfurireducens]|uniref:Nucleotide-binding protein, UspA family n=1 Tax=Natrarchaeobaculum sulfurireducens TaxID=2044521 RepID=A0A346PC11_9EURY|nr:universal stress protein [Natrarchaeobaculum sulfurireducens]AXR77056.1 Nucleotide-binding protein, UspA family [Natrarchaeobaculum sulfurireducens]
MFDRILVPTDGSGPANAALEYAGEIAAREDLTVTVLHVVDPDDDPPEASVEDLLEEGRTWAAEADAPIIDAVRTGTPREAILEFAADRDVDAIVMGSRGRRGIGRLVLGSVTEGVVREADVPVLVVRGSADVRRRYPVETVLVPTDGSVHADAALEHALAIGDHLEADVHVVTSVDVSPAELGEGTDLRLDRLETHAQSVVDDATDRAASVGLEVTTAVRHGSIARTIGAYADEHDVDLLIMGTHGRSGIDRLLLGSATERVLRTAPAPVLTIRAPETDQ